MSVSTSSNASIAQLGERKTEDLEALCSIHSWSILFGCWIFSTNLASYHYRYVEYFWSHHTKLDTILSDEVRNNH